MNRISHLIDAKAVGDFFVAIKRIDGQPYIFKLEEVLQYSDGSIVFKGTRYVNEGNAGIKFTMKLDPELWEIV